MCCAKKPGGKQVKFFQIKDRQFQKNNDSHKIAFNRIKYVDFAVLVLTDCVSLLIKNTSVSFLVPSNKELMPLNKLMISLSF